ncbi:GcrA family cell cycle regulator, partial [Paracoccus yeei]|uniref:GcrA family cell cycle regulator n=1 Tax=Paracoccus yeei TaxID=147645 RepID=UPI0037C6BC9C
MLFLVVSPHDVVSREAVFFFEKRKGEKRGKGGRGGRERCKRDGAQPAAPAEPAATQPAGFNRRTIVPAGQPLPPQPSANEISPEALASVREVEKRARKLTLMELTERTCKWPIGDPATDKFWFCGLPSAPGKPYCEAHVGVAFQPMSSRRDRRR